MNRFALVVSVCNYPSASKLAPLPGAKEDADAIMAKLKEAGFDVTPLADCTAQELRNEINELKVSGASQGGEWRSGALAGKAQR